MLDWFKINKEVVHPLGRMSGADIIPPPTIKLHQRPMILQSRHMMYDRDIEENEKLLSEKLDRKVVIIPCAYDIRQL
ncbi:MAG: hypothetical protein RR620_11895 [Clostridium sp.]